MMRLSDRDWKVFKIKEVFDIVNLKPEHKVNLKSSGITPYVTRTEKNNGVEDFYKGLHIKKGNCITFGAETAKFYYQEHNFINGNKLYAIYNKSLNKYTALFLTTLFNNQFLDYGYGFGLTGARFSNKKIKLPTLNKHPDYNFMEDYIKEKYFNLKSQIKEKQKHEITDYRELNQVEWKVFEMDDIFRFVQGKSKGLNHLKKGGNVPYLGAKYSDNGVLTFVETENNLMSKGNCISFIRNGEGSMGLSIYKSESHIATSDITNGYNDFLNRYTGKFISTISNLVRGKYNFGYKRSLTRLKKEKIKLPTKNNRPDYNFMEQYMKRKENEILDRI
ncbi:restriction endonuclease subunit S [Staphylococcus epidermidis]|uniref:restriction endonuclease subunit S n=1 Tax=Staphylococcus epidermidis TaxID=1282 RepID=UPI0011A6213F|nr:restriction endonuclease subunit S [Staphylococcus epidermidis]